MMQDKYYMPYFLCIELACKGSGNILLATGFKEQLLTLRQQFNQPMIVTSCCRSFEYNAKIGGAANSFHIFNHPTRKPAGTAALDVSITNARVRGELINLAWSLGWSIGIHKNFLHLDRRSDYADMEQVVFVY